MVKKSKKEEVSLDDTRNDIEKEIWKCNQCGKDCFQDPRDYYMIQHYLWDQIHKGAYMLCMDCCEDRLGRKLTADDILVCHLTVSLNPYTMKIIKNEIERRLAMT